MAVGKNKRLSKGGKKGAKKKVTDVMTRKEWYDVVAPSVFNKRQICKTLTTKTTGNKLASDNLKGRVFEVCLGDLMEDESADHTCKKMKLKVEDIQGRSCITSFYGMDITRDKLSSMVKKWCTIIEGVTEAKTSDGFVLRIFPIAFTTRQTTQKRKNCYAQSSKVRKIREKMFEIINQAVQKSSLTEVVKKFQLEVIGKDIEKACSGIFPLRDVMIRKVKLVKSPKFDLGKLMDMHGGENGIPSSREEIGITSS
jgi:small subunit ribosomal protein S3Ae